MLGKRPKDEYSKSDSFSSKVIVKPTPPKEPPPETYKNTEQPTELQEDDRHPCDIIMDWVNEYLTYKRIQEFEKITSFPANRMNVLLDQFQYYMDEDYKFMVGCNAQTVIKIIMSTFYDACKHVDEKRTNFKKADTFLKSIFTEERVLSCEILVKKLNVK